MKSEKVTIIGMAGRDRWYEDACGTAHAMELVGERWSLLVIRELMFGARRFGEIKAALTGISANVLTQRLEGLEAAGALHRRRLPSPANAQVYELTDWGYEAEPAIQALGRWAARSPDHDPTLPFSAASAMLSLRTMIDHEAARPLGGTLAFRLGADAFVATLADGELPIVRGEGVADVTVTAVPEALAAAIYGKAALDGLVAVEGDRSLFERFVDLFNLPEKFSRERGGG